MKEQPDHTLTALLKGDGSLHEMGSGEPALLAVPNFSGFLLSHAYSCVSDT